MWENCLSGSERGWRATMERVKYCGTVGKPGGNRENKPHPKAMGASSLLEPLGCQDFCIKSTFIYGQTLRTRGKITAEL
jgi:hypothetical protein